MKVWVGPVSSRPNATGVAVGIRDHVVARAGGDLVLAEGHQPADLEGDAGQEGAEPGAAELLGIALERGRACRCRAHHVHDPVADAEVRLRRGADREGHEHRGVLPDVVEGHRLRAAQVAVGAGLVGAHALFDREEQTGPLRDDQGLAAEGRNAGPVLRRGIEEHDPALAAHVPLEVAVARLLRGGRERPQGQRQRRDRNASREHAHHRLPP